jgi:hypothetical protein
MTEANPQPAATTTNAEPAAPAADNGAQTSDLDTLLSSYDEQVARQPAPQPAIQPNGNTEIAAALQEIKTFRQERALDRDNADTTKAVKDIKGELDVPDYAVRGWLLDRAETDRAIGQIWAERDRNPRAANKLVAALKTEFAKQHAAESKKPDPEATADRIAVTAAVRGASTNQAPPDKAPAYGKMNDSEWRAELQKLGVS